MSWIPCAQALGCNDFHITYSKGNIPSICSWVSVYLYSVQWIKCVCMGVLDKMCSQVAAQKQCWRRSMAADDQLHVDIRCLKWGVRKGNFHRVQTINQQQQALQLFDSVWCSIEQIRSSYCNNMADRVWVKTSADRSLRCRGWGHREVTVPS